MIADVQAPSGSLVITGSDPPFSSVADRALEISLIQGTIGACSKLGDLAHHALLVLFRLRTGGIVFKHDVGGLIRVVLGKFPAFHGGANEADHLVFKGRILELVFQHVNAVLQRRHALVFILEHDQIIFRKPGIDNLPVFVIGHGRHAVGLLLQDRVHIEALLENLHPVSAAVGCNAKLAHPRQERIFVAEEPHTKRLALEVCR